MKVSQGTILFFALLFSASFAASQSASEPSPSITQTSEVPATVTFLFDWSVGQPWRSYSIRLKSTGATHFAGQPNAEDGGDTDEYQQDFVMSYANRQRIFDLAEKAHYFGGDFEFKKKIAQTGKKTLQFESPQAHGLATYNWSENPDIQELTRIFQSIALTMDYGRKLAFQYRFDKLGMDQRIRELQDLQARGQVEELGAIEPILHKIADDPGMMHISRQAAKQLLKTIQSSQASSAPPAATSTSAAGPQH